MRFHKRRWESTEISFLTKSKHLNSLYLADNNDNYFEETRSSLYPVALWPDNRFPSNRKQRRNKKQRAYTANCTEPRYMGVKTSVVHFLNRSIGTRTDPLPSSSPHNTDNTKIDMRVIEKPFILKVN